MTAQVETTNKDRKQTFWQTTKSWLMAFDGGVDYEPDEYTNTMFRHLLRKVEQLETRVSEIETEKLTS